MTRTWTVILAAVLVVLLAANLSGEGEQAYAWGGLTLPLPTTSYTIGSTFSSPPGHDGYDFNSASSAIIASAPGVAANHEDPLCQNGAVLGCDLWCKDGGSIPPGQMGFGRWVDVDHGGGLHTIYAHLASFSTSGGSVARGEQIGVMGQAGCATGVHLHFAVKQVTYGTDGTYVDPGDLPPEN